MTTLTLKTSQTTIKSLLYFLMERSRKLLRSQSKRRPGQNNAEAEETWQKEMIPRVQSLTLMTQCRKDRFQRPPCQVESLCLRSPSHGRICQSGQLQLERTRRLCRRR